MLTEKECRNALSDLKNIIKDILGDESCVDECIKEILEEYKEPIKLTKFEYDLLKAYQKLKGDGEFSDHYILMVMQYKGHFKNVDYNLTIEEILDNCEVVDR